MHAPVTDSKTQAANTPLVEVSGLGIERHGRWLVRDVSFTVGRGEIVTLIGPNGSGKTTTVKAVTGLMTPDEGRIRLAPGVRIGYAPQKLVIDWTMPLSVERLMTLTRPYSHREVEEALAACGAGHIAGRNVQSLSGGEFQRVLMAQAIIGKPDLLILDEPVQGLDFSGEIALYELIGTLRDELGCAVLLISHDLHIVMASTDTVVCLNGHVCCHGTPQVVAQSPEYRELFGPRAAETLAVYQHHHDHAHGPDGEIIDGHEGHHHHHHGHHHD